MAWAYIHVFYLSCFPVTWNNPALNKISSYSFKLDLERWQIDRCTSMSCWHSFKFTRLLAPRFSPQQILPSPKSKQFLSISTNYDGIFYNNIRLSFYFINLRKWIHAIFYQHFHCIDSSKNRGWVTIFEHGWRGGSSKVNCNHKGGPCKNMQKFFERHAVY